MLQRLYRLKDAPKYLGIDKNVFNRDGRPQLTEIRHGRAVLFDRLELDAWADYKKSHAGRPPQRKALWHEEGHPGSANADEFGISINKSEGMERYMRAREQVISRKQNAT